MKEILQKSIEIAAQSKEKIGKEIREKALAVKSFDPDRRIDASTIKLELKNNMGFDPDKRIEKTKNTFNDLSTIKRELGKTYGEIKETKPPNAPNIAKWFEKGGSMRIEEVDGKTVWTYIDSAGREVSYIDGYPEFPPEAKHPVIDDIDIGKFTGDRNEDKKLYLEKLEEKYGLTEVPDGYVLHHDCKNGNMQLVKTDWHREFTHAGGHSLFREV